jgi:hypothetical protein
MRSVLHDKSHIVNFRYGSLLTFHQEGVDMIYPELALKTIDRLISTVQETQNLSQGLDNALLDLVTGLQIDRALLWQVVVTDLTVTNQYPIDGAVNVLNKALDAMRSTNIVLNFMSDNGSEGIIELQDNGTASDSKEWAELSEYLRDYSSSIIMPMRARGILPGFLLFQSAKARTWKQEDRATLSSIRRVIAVLLSYEFDVRRQQQVAKPSQL